MSLPARARAQEMARPKCQRTMPGRAARPAGTRKPGKAASPELKAAILRLAIIIIIIIIITAVGTGTSARRPPYVTAAPPGNVRSKHPRNQLHTRTSSHERRTAFAPVLSDYGGRRGQSPMGRSLSPEIPPGAAPAAWAPADRRAADPQRTPP